MNQPNYDPNHDPSQNNSPQNPGDPQPQQPQQPGSPYTQQPNPQGYPQNQQNPQGVGQGYYQSYPQQPGYGQPGYGQPVYIVQPDLNSNAMWAHLAGLLGFLIPLIVWAVYKDKPGYERVRTAAARSFNLSITALIAVVCSMILMFAVMALGLFIGTQSGAEGIFALVFALFPLLWVLMFGIMITEYILHIIAAVKSSSGEDYKYPVPTFHMLR